MTAYDYDMTDYDGPETYGDRVDAAADVVAEHYVAAVDDASPTLRGIVARVDAVVQASYGDGGAARDAAVMLAALADYYDPPLGSDYVRRPHVGAAVRALADALRALADAHADADYYGAGAAVGHDADRYGDPTYY